MTDLDLVMVRDKQTGAHYPIKRWQAEADTRYEVLKDRPVTTTGGRIVEPKPHAPKVPTETKTTKGTSTRVTEPKKEN